MGEPEITLCVSFQKKAVFDYEVETYLFDTAFCIKEGKIAYRFGEGKENTAEGGQVIFCPAGTAFHREMKSPATFTMIGVAANPAHPGTGEAPITVRDPARFFDDLDRLARVVVCSGMDKFPIIAHFCRDLIYLARESRELPPSPLEKEYARLTAHPESTVSVAALAASAGYSTARFIELFRARWGMTPKDYLLSLRIARAQMLLHTTDLSVSEIAHRVGYEDPLYFSRLFRGRTGNSPAQERALAKL